MHSERGRGGVQCADGPGPRAHCALTPYATCTQSEAEAAFSVLTGLVRELIARAVAKKQPKLLLRRTESVGEKMLTAWLCYGMHSFLTSHAGAWVWMCEC